MSFITLYNKTMMDNDGVSRNTNELYSLAWLGIQTKYEYQKRDLAVERLDEEIEVISNNDLTSLFFDALSVRTWIEEQNIMCAPGYAHLPSSLLAYVLDLTRIDPLHYGLYFERFYNTNVGNKPFITFIIPSDYVSYCYSFIKSLKSISGIKCLGCECIKPLKRCVCLLHEVQTIEETVLQTLKQGRTQGMEPEHKSAWISLLKAAEPNTVEELINLWTLSRPGLNILIPLYLNRKESKDNITYPHPDLIPIFKSTLGLCLFQEQIIETLNTVCGITPAKAEWMRRILGKKKYPATEKIKKELIGVFRNRGYSIKEAMTVFNFIYKHAGIAYCKAHAASEAHLHYESALSLGV